MESSSSSSCTRRLSSSLGGENFLLCFCGVQATIKHSNTEKNPRRKFWGCGRYGLPPIIPCKFFVWCDEINPGLYRVFNGLVKMYRDMKEEVEDQKGKILCLEKELETTKETLETTMLEVASLEKKFKITINCAVFIIIALMLLHFVVPSVA